MAVFAKETGFELAAPCGLYCGNCEIFRAYKDDDFGALAEFGKEMSMPVDQIRCDGCRTEFNMSWCPECEIRTCCEERDVSFCFECEDFPCIGLIDFQDECPHHSVCMDNLQRMAEVGIGPWLEEQDAKWRCPACKTKITYYTESCPNCYREISID